tara:strand:+ start:458 stop:607 length:150 start_codon:yes stop_codon:yes gene_type:complete
MHQSIDQKINEISGTASGQQTTDTMMAIWSSIKDLQRQDFEVSTSLPQK